MVRLARTRHGAAATNRTKIEQPRRERHGMARGLRRRQPSVRCRLPCEQAKQQIPADARLNESDPHMPNDERWSPGRLRGPSPDLAAF
jgi:hypothetical protein